MQPDGRLQLRPQQGHWNTHLWAEHALFLPLPGGVYVPPLFYVEFCRTAE